jgi:hypothetical protein
MTKTRFTLALTVAICAAVAITATTATAFFKAESYPAKIEATNVGEHKFEIGPAGNEASLACAKAKFVGILNQESSQASVRPEYGECKALISGFSVKTTVQNTGCYFNFHQAKGVFTGTVSVVCQPQKQIIIKTNEIISCTIWVIGQPQSSQKNQYLSGIKYENAAGPPKTVIVKATGVTPISYNSSGCPSPIEAEGNNSKYNGEAKVAGFNQSGGTVNVEVV